MERQTKPVAKLQTERGELVGEAVFFRLGPQFGDLIRRHAGLDRRDRSINPFARLDVGVALRGRRPADVERSIVTGPVSLEGMDHVEECLVAGAEQTIGKVVRVRTATLS